MGFGFDVFQSTVHPLKRQAKLIRIFWATIGVDLLVHDSDVLGRTNGRIRVADMLMLERL
jgi:hypothetical protein